MDWRERHRAHVAELEAAATDVMLGALGPILAGVAGQFAVVATTAAAGDEAEARASLDDLASIDVQWRAAVHNEVLPWFGTVYQAGAEAAVEQVVGLGIAVLDVDQALLDHAAATYLSGVENRFYPLGDAAWAQAREELTAGFSEGEGIDALRARIRSVTDLTTRQAEMLARTEVISASNMGAQARVDLMGDDAPPYRQWLSTMDGRTRPTHRAADGQVAPRGTPFTVGGSSLSVPGDPSGPAREVINCRCTVLFTDTADPLLLEGRQQGGIVDEVAEDGTLAAATGPPQVDSTTGEPHTGAMVALVPSAEDAERLAVNGAGTEGVESLHLTLAYLGDGDEIPDPAFDAMLAAADGIAAGLGPVTANVFGAAVWNPAGEASLVLNVGDDPENDSPALEIAHLAGQALIAQGQAAEPDWAPPPNHSPWVAHVCLSYDPDTAGSMREVAAAAVGPITFDRLRLTRGSEAYDFTLAGALPEEENPDMDRAQLNAMVEEAVAAGIARAGATGPVNLTINLAAPLDDMPAPTGEPGDPTSAGDEGPPAQPGEHLRAVMHRQGESTGLNGTGRVFTNMTYRPTPFAYHWMVDAGAHGGTPRVVPVGLVTRIVETDTGDYGFVRLDLENADALEHARRAVAGFDRWVSIGGDETAATITVVWPAPGEGAAVDGAEFPEVDPEEPFEEVIPQPERVIFDGVNVGELTGVSMPAQADAVLEPTAELLDLLGGDTAALAASARPGELAAVPLEARGVAPYQRLTHGGCGCSGACGGCGTVDVETPGVGVVTRVFEAEAALTAAAAVIELTDLPPAAWFQEPTDVELTSALSITDEGRIYGLLAPYGTSHRAYARSPRPRYAPRGNVDYARFMGRWAVTDEGRIPAGPLTMDCGHAPIHRADHQVAVEHYDNTCSVFGAVAVGESERLGGVWIAGSVLPGATPAQLARALACACSGDWQPHPDKSGWQELVATLLVPAPGFAMAHAHATTSYRGDALVASTVPVVHVPTAEAAAARARAATISRLATAVGRTPAARVLAAANRAGR